MHSKGHENPHSQKVLAAEHKKTNKTKGNIKQEIVCEKIAITIIYFEKKQNVMKLNEN